MTLTAKVATGNLAALAAVFLLPNVIPGGRASWFCDHLWQILIFPIGWCGLMLLRVSATKGIALLFLSVGVIANAYSWGWAVSKITKVIQRWKKSTEPNDEANDRGGRRLS
jgi:hypothetical protein